MTYWEFFKKEMVPVMALVAVAVIFLFGSIVLVEWMLP